MNTLKIKEMNLSELDVNHTSEIEGGMFALPTWLKVSITIGVAGAAGYAVGRYA